MEEQQKPLSPNDIVDTRRVAEELGWIDNTLVVHRIKNTGPQYFKVGRSVRYRWADVLRWLESRRVKTSEQDQPLVEGK